MNKRQITASNHAGKTPRSVATILCA